MDVREYIRVLKRFRTLVAIGLLAATILAIGSYYRVGLDGATPSLEPRKEEVWQASSTLFLTQKGFPAGRTEQPIVLRKIGNEETPVARYADPGRFTSLAPLYARLANSDAVRRRILNDGNGPLEGKAKAIPTADTSYGALNGLPMISIFGTAPTREGALRTTKRATAAFMDYLSDNQKDAGIAGDKRVLIEVINAPGELTLILPRKKTLPVFVFLAILFATIAVAFVRDNARPALSVQPSSREGDEDSRGVHVPPAPAREEPAASNVRRGRWA
jgi:hypothetical protein